MRIYTASIMTAVAAVALTACAGGAEDIIATPSIEVTVDAPSASGCVVDVAMGENTVSYYMKVYAESAFSEAAALEELPHTMPFTQEQRIIERLYGEKNYCIAAIPLSGSGAMGELSVTRFELTAFSLRVNLYTPGEGTGADLNKFNTLRIEAYSNGLAAEGHMAMSLNSSWRALKDLKGLNAAAEEVFSTAGVVRLTQQQLEHMADRTEYKSDLSYFTELEAGTKYSLVVCLTDLDGGIHYYDFEGSTAPPEEPQPQKE